MTLFQFRLQLGSNYWPPYCYGERGIWRFSMFRAPWSSLTTPLRSAKTIAKNLWFLSEITQWAEQQSEPASSG